MKKKVIKFDFEQFTLIYQLTQKCNKAINFKKIFYLTALQKFKIKKKVKKKTVIIIIILANFKINAWHIFLFICFSLFIFSLIFKDKIF